MERSVEETAALANDFLNTPYGKYFMAKLDAMVTSAHEKAEDATESMAKLTHVDRAKAFREVKNMVTKEAELYADGYFDQQTANEAATKGGVFM